VAGLFTALAAAAACAAPASEGEGVRRICGRVPSGFQSVTTRAELPPALARELEDAGMPADRDYRPLHWNLMIIWHKDRIWIVGGSADRGPVDTPFVQLYRVNRKGDEAKDITPPDSYGINREWMCAQARQYAYQFGARGFDE
jgi:hypothetical protein